MKFKVQKVVTSEYEVEAENADRAKFNIEEFGNLKATNAKVSVEEISEEEHMPLDLLKQFIELSEKQLCEQERKQQRAEDEAFTKLYSHWEEIRLYCKEKIIPIMNRIHISSISFGDYGLASDSDGRGTFWRICRRNKQYDDWRQYKEFVAYEGVEIQLKRQSIHAYKWLFPFCSTWDKNRILLESELAKKAQQYFEKHKEEAANSAAYYIKESDKL